MFVHAWSVLGVKVGLLILIFYPIGSFVLKVKGDSRVCMLIVICRRATPDACHGFVAVNKH